MTEPIHASATKPFPWREALAGLEKHRMNDQSYILYVIANTLLEAVDHLETLAHDSSERWDREHNV
jgi:hypothetical protein